MNLYWNLRFKSMTIKFLGVIETETEEVRNDLSYNIVSLFPREIESAFFEILLPSSKPITVGTIYRSPNQSNFLEVVNENMNKIDPINNEIYILGDFNMNLSLNDSCYITNEFQVTLKATMNFVLFFACIN